MSSSQVTTAIALLKTCRQTYREVWPHLYEKRIFSFDVNPLLIDFMRRPSAKHILSNVRYVYIWHPLVSTVTDLIAFLDIVRLHCTQLYELHLTVGLRDLPVSPGLDTIECLISRISVSRRIELGLDVLNCPDSANPNNIIIELGQRVADEKKWHCFNVRVERLDEHGEFKRMGRVEVKCTLESTTSAEV